jgi:hypothetical protein
MTTEDKIRLMWIDIARQMDVFWPAVPAYKEEATERKIAERLLHFVDAEKIANRRETPHWVYLRAFEAMLFTPTNQNVLTLSRVNHSY